MNIIFTNHAKEAIRDRKILESEVIESIKYPDKTIKKHGKIYIQKNLERGQIEISTERTENVIKIITVYWL